MYTALLAERANLGIMLRDAVDQPTYQLLLNNARDLAESIPNGRLLVTLPDGTTVVDTSKTDDAACDISDVDCGAWGGYPEDVPVGCPCANGQRNARLGDQYDNEGTARLSLKE